MKNPFRLTGQELKRLVSIGDTLDWLLRDYVDYAETLTDAPPDIPSVQRTQRNGWCSEKKSMGPGFEVAPTSGLCLSKQWKTTANITDLWRTRRTHPEGFQGDAGRGAGLPGLRLV